jgi:hypothetical protein
MSVACIERILIRSMNPTEHYHEQAIFQDEGDRMLPFDFTSKLESSASDAPGMKTTVGDVRSELLPPSTELGAEKMGCPLPMAAYQDEGVHKTPLPAARKVLLESLLGTAPTQNQDESRRKKGEVSPVLHQ